MVDLDFVPALLRADKITKRFPGVIALQDVSFDVHAGEVHVLVGENGAGKSTLIKILAGAYRPDEGKIFIDQKPVRFREPRDAQALGIFTIYQELPLVPQLSVAENILLGQEREVSSLSILTSKSTQFAKTKELLERLEFPLDPGIQVQDLLIGEQQMVAIAKALVGKVRILILDEPTGALTDREVKVLFQLIRRLGQNGVAIIYISHRLEEAKEIGDRITVLRDGKTISTTPIADVELPDIIRMMVGREIKEKFPKTKVPIGGPLLKVENLTRHKFFQNITFVLHKGEILCLTGLVGSGTTELGRSLYGIGPVHYGKILLEGREVDNRSPGKCIRLGFGYIPADRKRDGVIHALTVKQNISLAVVRRLSRFFILRDNEETRLAEDFRHRLRIKAPSVNTLVENLSGGNQQKVVLAKILSTEARVFIFDHPTAGIDVGAKAEIYQFMGELVHQGAGIILISSELPECLAMGDRILVFHAGSVAGELKQEEATQERILKLAFGHGLREVTKEAP